MEIIEAQSPLRYYYVISHSDGPFIQSDVTHCGISHLAGFPAIEQQVLRAVRLLIIAYGKSLLFFNDRKGGRVCDFVEAINKARPDTITMVGTGIENSNSLNKIVFMYGKKDDVVKALNLILKEKMLRDVKEKKKV